MTDHEKFLSRAAGFLQQSAIRQMGAVLAQAKDMISFAPGYPAEDAFPWRAFQEIAAELLSGTDGSVLQYGPTRGYRPLGDAIIGLMHQRRISTASERLVVTTGSQQGLDLVARVLLDPGDVALVELPSYTGAITAFRNAGAELVGVRQESDGIDLAHLDDTFNHLRREGRRVKFLYLVPNFQNPTGLMIGLDKRREVLDWANRHDVLIVEDDPYRELYFPDVTTEADTRPIAADDSDERVIYLSSFSKTLAPGLRVAWLSAPPVLAAKFELAKQASDLCSGVLDQRIAYEACRRGVLEQHLPELRAHYQNKRDAMITALNAELPDRLTWDPPRGGFFLWARLTGALDAEHLLTFARARGVIFVVGTAFFVDGQGRDYIRLSFSAPPPPRIREGVSRLAAAMRDATSPPAQHAAAT